MTQSRSNLARRLPENVDDQSSTGAQAPFDPETSEFLWKVLFEQNPEAVAVLTPDDRILRINKEFVRLFGYGQEEAVNHAINELIVPSALAESAEAYKRLLRQGSRIEVETVRKRKDGTEVQVSLLAVPVTTPAGELLVHYAIYRDITERKHSEEQLRESEARFQSMADKAPVMIWTTGTDGLCNYFSKPWLDFTGRTMEQEVGLGWMQGVHPDDAQLCFDRFLPAFEAKKPFSMEYRLKRVDGQYRWVIESGVPRYTGDGEFAGYIGSNIDITDRKRAEETARRSERELRDVIETIPAIAWSALPDGSNAFANSRWTEYTGIPPERTAGSGWHSAIHPDDAQRHDDKWLESVATGKPFEIEVRMRRADGQYRWHLVRGLPFRGEQGEILKWYGLSTDIEDRKQAEACLAAEKRILELVAKGDTLPDILNALCRMAENQAAGVLASILLLEDDRLRHGGGPNLPRPYMEAIDGGAIGPAAGSCGTAAFRGEQVIVEDIAIDPLWADYRPLALAYGLRACWSTPVFSTQRRVIATFAMYYREPRRPTGYEQDVIQQITHLAGVAIERKLAQDALRRSEGYLAEAQKISHIGSYAFNLKTDKFAYWSEENFRIWGFDPQQGLPSREMTVQRLHAEDRQRVSQETFSAILEGKDHSFECRIVLPDGMIRDIHWLGHPIFSANGGIVEVVGTHVDITERKRAEQALRRSETYLAEAQRLTHTGSWAYNPATQKALYWSDEMFRICGFDPGQGPPTSEAFLKRVHPEDRETVREVMRRAAEEKVEYEVVHRIVLPDGSLKHIHAIGHPVLSRAGGVVEFVGSAVDTTERKQAEEERERSRQMEADLARLNRVSMMGEFAASLAHEIKQPISAAAINAGTCSAWLTREQPDFEEARRAASRIIQDVTRASDIIARVRSLFKKEESRRDSVDVNGIIREMIGLLQSETGGRSIAIQTDLADGLPLVRADRVQIQQVLMNLALNAVDAIKDSNSVGTITIKSQLDSSGALLISVSDTGVGLSCDQMDKIFDAFFTTKSQGTGMGLSISRSIVESHSGHLWATPNAGPGVTFLFTLPISADLKAA
ncbi:MAG TPA: PAS domain S-box protein [Candidatus Binatia bacterium]|nr:PAS domain S-box protein [Candidatus Binatia bacterium]